MQFALPGRTTGVLSSGVVPYANDPMIPASKYFKPKGLDREVMFPFMLTNHQYVTKQSACGFMLYASPWNADEHPRDHNGLRFRDYRVACMVTKKNFKKVYPRWRIARLLRTAAMMVLPDKGMKRCDYLFFAHADLARMDRDQLFLEVDQAMVAVEKKILRQWQDSGRRRRPVLYPGVERISRPKDKQHSDRKPKKEKILKVVDADEDKRIESVADIVEEWRA
ncbi:hypothetical protein EC988_004617 [Linderina pennispora]|nr:hypothetical protein EC988_004617 [Linderina pennispora]